MQWHAWRAHFEANAGRPMPPMRETGVAPTLAPLLASSLARFALGETGEGRIVAQVRTVDLPGIDNDYREALRLFVGEEGRHAAILGRAVRALGGEVPTGCWSEVIFRGARGMVGVRTKLLVLLAAEVVAVGAYGALARALPPGDLRDALAGIVDDEAAHLRFHADFFRTTFRSPWEPAAFRAVWRSGVAVAATTVCTDHAALWHTLGVRRRDLIRTLGREALRAERLATSP